MRESVGGGWCIEDIWAAGSADSGEAGHLSLFFICRHFDGTLFGGPNVK